MVNALVRINLECQRPLFVNFKTTKQIDKHERARTLNTHIVVLVDGEEAQFASHRLSASAV